MAEQRSCWMADADWLCCSVCRAHAKMGGTFLVSSCGHIFCISCKERAPSGICQRCGCSNVEYVQITEDIKEHPHIGHYFCNLEETCEKLAKLLKFQHFHQDKFWTVFEESPSEAELVREFGDLALADLSELQSRLGTAVTDIRQLEGRKLQQEQRIQQLAREEEELEQCLRRWGMDPTPKDSSYTEQEDRASSNTATSTPRVTPIAPSPAQLPPPPAPPSLPGMLSPAAAVSCSPFAMTSASVYSGMPPPQLRPIRANRKTSVLPPSPASSWDRGSGMQQFTPQSVATSESILLSPMSAHPRQEMTRGEQVRGPYATGQLRQHNVQDSYGQPSSQLLAHLTQRSSAARDQRQTMLPSPRNRIELPHPSTITRTRTPSGMHSASPSPRTTPNSHIPGQRLFRGAKVSATVSRGYPNGVRSTTPSPATACAARPTPPSTGPRRLSVRGRPVDGKIGTIPNSATPNSSVLQLLQDSGLKPPTPLSAPPIIRNSTHQSASHRPGFHSSRTSLYPRPVA